METNYRKGDRKIKTISLGLLIFWFGVGGLQADLRLFVLVPEAYVGSGKAVQLDIYLYNDGKTAITVPSLMFASTNWSLTDTSGKERGVRAGVSRVVSDHGTADIIVPPGAVLYQRTELDVGAEAGDVVTIRVQLGKKRRLESNSACVYYQ